MNEWILIGVFVVATIVGYFIIRNVPSLLHTPLMSGMNALSGISILGAITVATVTSLKFGNIILGSILGNLAIVLASINIFGGFGITHKMLKMFDKKTSSKEEDKK